MLGEERDPAYLWDMRKAARDVLELTRGIRQSDLQSNKTLRYALERLLMIIGEAARKISQTFKDAHLEIPWTMIVAQRNVIAHEYGDDIVLPKIWMAVTKSVPALLEKLDPLIPPPPEEK